MIRSFSIILIVSVFVACNQTTVTNSKELKNDSLASHNAQNSLDVEGVYRGTLPCADCSGIETKIELSSNYKYKIERKYLGKEDTKLSYSEGKYTWDTSQQNVIVLIGLDAPNQYFVAENMLIQLDMNGEKITGELANNYQLIKQ